MGRWELWSTAVVKFGWRVSGMESFVEGFAGLRGGGFGC